MRLPKDPRLLQIAFLTSFLLAGIFLCDFDLPLWLPPVTVASACAAQWACVKLFRLASQGYRSPIITGLGVSILLRSDLLWLVPLFAAVAIASKFFLRHDGRHYFNPTTFGLATAMLLTGHAWCSPAQWTDSAAIVVWFVVLGLAVTVAAFRSDVTLAVLGSWFALAAGRVLYLGQSLRVLEHQLTFGSLIMFAFFMISDPKTTPSHRTGRLILAAAVAGLGFVFQFGLFWQNALIWALLLGAPLTALLDRLFPAAPYQWPGAPALAPATR